MRAKLVLVLLVAFGALALLVSTATAGNPEPTTSSPPGATYPWVQPVWQTVHGVVVVTLPRTIVTANTQPPVWVLSR